MRPLSTLIVVWGVASLGHAQERITDPIKEETLRNAAGKAIQIVQQSQKTWYKKQGCTACHHQILPTLMLAMAHERDVPYDPQIERDVIAKTYGFMKDFDAVAQGVNYIDENDNAWRLHSNRASGFAPSLSTSVEAQFLLSAQRTDGSWHTFDSRPPSSYSRFTTTALSVQALHYYLPETFRNEKATAMAKAAEWLVKATPRSTEDRAFQLLGHAWATNIGTKSAVDQRQAMANQLLAEQHDDGGWGQLPGMPSDAYSTGQVLVALDVTRIPHEKPGVVHRGLQFLLKTQLADGSWKVDGRLHPPAPVSPPYVSAEFPHGRTHQYSSITGTAWAAMALLNNVSKKTDRAPAMKLPDLTPKTDEWVNIVVNGSVADLKKALANGFKANAKTAKGTTALMLATHSLEKVQLLLDAGADATVRAESGFDALIVASRFRGNAEMLKLLLKNGAKVKASKEVVVQNNGSAIFFAASNGDLEMVRVLLDAGAAVNDRMTLLGMIPMNTLESATLRGDTAMLSLLLERGANVNEANGAKMTPLSWAAIGGQTDVVKLLLAKGAKPNIVDEMGMTPLLYAASINFGDTLVVEQLLTAGADRNAKDERGRTAHDLAKLYQHQAITKVLAK